MDIDSIAIAEFASASTAGVVDVMLGFEPAAALIVIDHGGTNPNLYLWFDNAQTSSWAAALALLVTGSTGVITRLTSGPTVYAGAERITSAESVNDDPKHVDQSGNEVGKSGITSDIGTVPFVTQGGLAIPAAMQVNSGKNMIVAFRRNR